ncbi:MAG: RnfABCDGE type electron transport complex subunit G [Clostridia bacterium]|nr:RnfABCDGE type electron transport complex subunit G [Clostridia bacterium]
MDKKNIVKEVITVAVILFAITAVAAAILAAVNSVTAPVIAENDRKAQEIAMKQVLPDATAFDKMEYEMSENSSVTEVYKSDAGYAVKVAPKGYGGAISMIVGVDNDLKVTGVEIISQSETAGLGSKCTNSEFKAQFIGKTEGIAVAKNATKENEIDAITSATITSKAVTKGVNDAIKVAREAKGDE